ncbi:hypothetical protein E2562_037487 [Oryza meyeriana var. granulata]|uniref:Uncharacterized protein n=1 Tax=Oryza meyeriana var. granulata TaxID=110450 RepID=A0A6G1CY16_9ORYZ|nr:hypothetical protein E2562_037487 [Oryza meyeriana var. granulata]
MKRRRRWSSSNAAADLELRPVEREEHRAVDDDEDRRRIVGVSTKGLLFLLRALVLLERRG